ncbi:MAG: glycosyltransferase family 4 protein [Thermoleophilia bacterium]
MRILICHVAYRTRGGEDVVVDTESTLLRDAGHDVEVVNPQSEEFDALPMATKMRIAASRGDHPYGRQLVADAIQRFDPDIVHFHNLYPNFGWGAMAEAADRGCGVVQTLHNYRLSCLNGLHFLMDEGVICERCRPGDFGPGIARGCYRGSRAQSAVMARWLTGQWNLLRRRRVPHMSLAISDFQRDRLVADGLDPRLIRVKVNCVPRLQQHADRKGVSERGGVVFVGRASREKGALELVEAWPLDAPHLTLAGDGPLVSRLTAMAGRNVSVVGAVSRHQVLTMVEAALVLAAPSLCLEGAAPLTVLEGMARGTPPVVFAGGAAEHVAEQVSPECVATRGSFGNFVQRCLDICRSSDWASLSGRSIQVIDHGFAASREIAGLASAYDEAAAARRRMPA